MSSYCPISLLNQDYKILTKIIANRLQSILAPLLYLLKSLPTYLKPPEIKRKSNQILPKLLSNKHITPVLLKSPIEG